ncbi:MAG: aldo/keto reductase [Caldilineae bacterium]|nr:aldo/keto reductase [Anaerolineae bacterium]MCB0203418.1 aldo/keto reductase [Anaerolineae bacterium]MCB9153303.1 aldo/keto reductase [Caldilineae bacterium]
MIYRTLGRTGLQVSVVGYGASPLGAEFGRIDPEEGRRAVHHAIACGINYFDVAPYYGRTLAETRLGEFLEDKRHQVILATKVGRYDIDHFDFSARCVVSSVDESLRRLRTDVIDVIQIHDIEYGDRAQIVHETLPALYSLVEAGKVRFVGITGYPLLQLADVISQTRVDTILSYCRYNLFDTTMDAMLTPVAKERGVGLINASPLHMRALTEKGAPDWHPAPQAVIEKSREVADWCRSQGVDIADLAMQYALAYDDVATTLVGMSKVSHVDSNVKAVGVAPDPRLLAEIQAMIDPVADVVWREGRPENDDPGAVPKQS